jgi:hypothetical protein
MVKTVLRECSRCNKVRDNVWEESCNLERCGTTISVCLSNASLMAVRNTFVIMSLMSFERNTIATKASTTIIKMAQAALLCLFGGYGFHDEYDLMEAEQYLYCNVHKPTGAVKLMPFYIQ